MSGVSVATHVSSYALHVSPVNEGLVATAVVRVICHIVTNRKYTRSLYAICLTCYYPVIPLVGHRSCEGSSYSEETRFSERIHEP